MMPIRPTEPTKRTKRTKAIELTKPTERIDYTLRLEREIGLNWWENIISPLGRKQQVVETKSDGNCLCHSVSKLLYAHDDEQKSLRNKMNTLMIENESALRDHFRKYQQEINTRNGFSLTDDQWKNEWHQIKSAVIQGDKSLEPFHVYILAVLVDRPIIVLASPNVKDIDGNEFSPSNFGGIYLPDAPDALFNAKKGDEERNRYSLLIAYHQSHFVALCCTERYALFPLVDSDFQRIPIQFTKDVVDLHKYLNIVYYEHESGPQKQLIPCARVLNTDEKLRPVTMDPVATLEALEALETVSDVRNTAGKCSYFRVSVWTK